LWTGTLKVPAPSHSGTEPVMQCISRHEPRNAHKRTLAVYLLELTRRASASPISLTPRHIDTLLTRFTRIVMPWKDGLHRSCPAPRSICAQVAICREPSGVLGSLTHRMRRMIPLNQHITSPQPPRFIPLPGSALQNAAVKSEAAWSGQHRVGPAGQYGQSAAPSVLPISDVLSEGCVASAQWEIHTACQCLPGCSSLDFLFL
jgi:hypothetical protein